MVHDHPIPSASIATAPAAGPWRVILEGALREQALETVRTIGDSLQSLPPEDITLGSGAAGLAVCFAYLAEGLAEPGHETTARRLLDQVINIAEAEPIPPSLYGGLAGIGWAARHLSTRLHWLDLEATLADIDGILLETLDQAPWREDYNLIHGLVGYGVYALERLQLACPESSKGVFDCGRMPFQDSGRAARQCLERVIGHLAATAERKPEGLTWWTGPERLSPRDLKKVPDGWYDVGLGEGVAGVIALLARACAAGISVRTARPLLADAVAWLLAQEAPHGPPEGFPYGIRPHRRQRNWTRSSWCYGDPGVAVALLGSARCVAEPAWERRALAAALRATTRPPERTRVFDAGLCVGAAGLGHLFNRLYQATGEPRLAEASRLWFQRTLNMRRPGHGIGGYAVFMPDDNDEKRWLDAPGILGGAAGIALALLSAARPLVPSWDRMMLVDIRSQAFPMTNAKT